MSNEESFYFILISGLILQIAPMALIIFTRNRVRENYTIHGYPSMYEPTTESFCYMAGGFCIFLGAAAAAILTLTDGGLKNNLIICFSEIFVIIVTVAITAKRVHKYVKKYPKEKIFVIGMYIFLMSIIILITFHLKLIYKNPILAFIYYVVEGR